MNSRAGQVRTGLRRSVPLPEVALEKSRNSGKLVKRGRLLEALGELIEDALSLEIIFVRTEVC